jgi:hypothetical protein
LVHPVLRFGSVLINPIPNGTKFLLYQQKALIARFLPGSFPSDFIFFLIYFGKLGKKEAVEIGAAFIQE